MQSDHVVYFNFSDLKVKRNQTEKSSHVVYSEAQVPQNSISVNLLCYFPVLTVVILLFSLTSIDTLFKHLL